MQAYEQIFDIAGIIRNLHVMSKWLTQAMNEILQQFTLLNLHSCFLIQFLSPP
jgi:hypothetical protein